MDIFYSVLGQFIAFAMIATVAYIGRVLFEFLRDEGTVKERWERCRKFMFGDEKRENKDTKKESSVTDVNYTDEEGLNFPVFIFCVCSVFIIKIILS